MKFARSVCVRLYGVLPALAGITSALAIHPAFHTVRYPRYHLDLRIFGFTFHAVSSGVAFGIPLLTLAASVTVASMPLIRAKKRATAAERRRRAGLCPHCNYDLRATPTRCPECGWVPSKPAPLNPPAAEP